MQPAYVIWQKKNKTNQTKENKETFWAIQVLNSQQRERKTDNDHEIELENESDKNEWIESSHRWYVKFQYQHSNKRSNIYSQVVFGIVCKTDHSDSQKWAFNSIFSHSHRATRRVCVCWCKCVYTTCIVYRYRYIYVCQGYVISFVNVRIKFMPLFVFIRIKKTQQQQQQRCTWAKAIYENWPMTFIRTLESIG